MTDSEKLKILEDFFWEIGLLGAVVYESSQTTGCAYVHGSKLINILNMVEADWYKLIVERRTASAQEQEPIEQEHHNNEH